MIEQKTVTWDSDRIIDYAIREYCAARLNLVKESYESLGIDLGDTDLFRNNFIKYKNYVAGSMFPGSPSGITPDSAIAVKYGMPMGLKLWLKCVEEMGEFYQEYIHTYEGHTEYATGEDGKTHGSQNLSKAMSSLSAKQKAEMTKRQGKRNGKNAMNTTAKAFSADSLYWTICDLFGTENFEVGDDCTAFVSACVHYFAYKSNKKLFKKWKNNPQWGSAGWNDSNDKTSVAVYLKELGFTHDDVPDSLRIPIKTDPSKFFEKGDIIVGNWQTDGDPKDASGNPKYGKYHHGEIYWGKIDDPDNRDKRYERNVKPGTKYLSQSWGSVHDKPEGNGKSVGSEGMPCHTALDPYKNRWRWTGKKQK